MTRVSGSVELELHDRHLAHAIGQELIAGGLAEAVADRVLARLAGGEVTYRRDDPDPDGPMPPRGTVRHSIDEEPR